MANFHIDAHDYINLSKVNCIGNMETEYTYNKIIENTKMKRNLKRISKSIENCGKADGKIKWRIIESSMAHELKHNINEIREEEFQEEVKTQISKFYRKHQTIDYDKQYYYYQGCIDIEDNSRNVQTIILSEILVPEESISTDILMDNKIRINYATSLFLKMKGLFKSANTSTVKLPISFSNFTPTYYIDYQFVFNLLEETLRNAENGIPPFQNLPHLRVDILNAKLDSIEDKISKKKVAF